MFIRNTHTINETRYLILVDDKFKVILLTLDCLVKYLKNDTLNSIHRKCYYFYYSAKIKVEALQNVEHENDVTDVGKQKEELMTLLCLRKNKSMCFRSFEISKFITCNIILLLKCFNV